MAAQAGPEDTGDTQFLWGMLPKAWREGESSLVPHFFPPPLSHTSASH